jgi:RNA polymerase sigma factor (TIGR02999 family)
VTSVESAEITQLLKAWSFGEKSALDRLVPKVYDELHRTARRYARNERAARTLQSTALVNEIYLRLVEVDGVVAERGGSAASMMRRILVEAARVRAAAKRGGHLRRAELSTDVNLDQIPDGSSQRDRELIAVDEALQELQQTDPRKARVIDSAWLWRGIAASGRTPPVK